MNLSNYGEVFNNYDLTNNNTYGLHSKCKYFVKVFDEISLKNLIEYLNKEKEKYFILGGGSNVILGDTLYDGVIISLEKLNDIKINNNIVEASSGILLSKFVNTLVDNNLEGYERLALIPGSLGGALYGNAGCHNTEIYDHLISIKILENNEIRTILKKDIKYSYRNTEFKKEKSIILSAKFELSYGDKEKMNEVYDVYEFMAKIIREINTQEDDFDKLLFYNSEVLKEDNYFEESLEEARKEALAEGREQSKLDIAKAMLEKNYDINSICDITNLSLDVLEKLQEGLK